MCLVHAQVSAAVRLLGVSAPQIVAVEHLASLVTVPLVVSRFLPGQRLSPGDATPGVWAALEGGSPVSIRHRRSGTAGSSGLHPVPVAAVGAMVSGYRAAGGRHDSLRERITWCRTHTAVHRIFGSARPVADASRAVAEAEMLLA